MTTATTTSSMGSATAILLRTARSCAAPFACHAAHRSSKLDESGTGRDVAARCGFASICTSVVTSVIMCPHAQWLW